MWYNMYCRSVYNIPTKSQRKEKTVGNYQNELEQFIYEVCYHPMWEKASQYISEHPYVLDLSRSRIKYPTSAYLENLSLEFTCNIRIAEDILSFDAVTNCSIALIEETEWNCGNSDIIQWLTISCEAKITDRLEHLKITNICPYQSDLHRAYMFCIGGLSGHSIEERNTFLESYGYPPLGTKQKK